MVASSMLMDQGGDIDVVTVMMVNDKCALKAAPSFHRPIDESIAECKSNR